MRRWATVTVVGGVVLVAVLAAADAFRGSGKQGVVQATTSTIHPRGRPTPGGMLKRDQISGQLIYSNPLCQLRVVLLPSLQQAPVLRETGGAERTGCKFSIAAGHYLPGDVAMTRDGETIARCAGQKVVVRNVVTNAVLARSRGCPVAWRRFPDGRSQLTQLRNGQIVANREVLISRAQLLAAARKHPQLVGLAHSISLRVAVKEFAWLDEHRVVAILDVSAAQIQRERMIVLLDDGRLIGMNIAFGGLINHLVVSADGTYAAAEPGTIMRIDGRSWDLPRDLGILHVLAFSPDERWLAVGTRASMLLISVTDIVKNEPEPRVNRVPAAATDLVWEAGGVTPDISKAG